MLLLQKSKGKGISESISLKDAFGKMVVICLIVGLSGLGLQLLLLIAYFKVANKPPPTLVQVKDGSSILVEPLDTLDREPKTIGKFVTDTLTVVFSWNGLIPASKPGEYLIDTGVNIFADGKKVGKVTTPAWEASYAFELSFRQKFLQELAALVPVSIFNNRTDTAFVPREILPPVSIGKGRWKVPVFANLLFVKQGTKLEEIVPYNVDVYLRAVTPVSDELAERVAKSKSTSLAALIAQIRQSGLEIYALVPYAEEDLIDGKSNLKAKSPETGTTTGTRKKR